MSTIGDNIREARKRLKMSQDELAEAIGANRVTISRYESGGYSPSVTALWKLAVALHTTPNQLNGEEETEVDEKWQLSERLRNDPDYRMLFDQVQKARPEHIRAAVAVLKSLEETQNE